FNGDGKLDVVVSNGASDELSIILGNGAGGFGPPITFTTGDGPTYPGIADFNNDGKPDIVTANYFGGDITVLMNNGIDSLDTSPPLISLMGGMVDATGPTGAQVPYVISAIDNSGRVATLSCHIRSGSVLPIGATPIMRTAS